ncbi:hypothetical protein IW261DRAFT_1453259 [Armillaria novae-zelandiae]|uniref:Asteroid domain-containing protein n=1 Tax=Armillaria novae-zelandiae TaxID=153914 RepID=A0AA39UEB2_9AGAR|nr:hypothetical protein IW261DRAFT_1453259 [Armillaria novae-zelandiae]
MGVHGLTTYLRENKRALSRTVQRCSLPWIYGGEYAEFARLVTDVVQAWISAGLRISFVFDGPYPELKHTTLISRASKSIIEPSLLFFRTSQASRTSPRFLKETQIIPPLYYVATLHALEQLYIHFSDEECDPYAVELAGRLGGYVLGSDSDFVVLNSDGYLGYIPLDGMVWTALIPDQVADVVNDDDDFQQVRKPKSRIRAAKAAPAFGKGVIPPENATQMALSFSVYSPSVLADHLKLPVTLLPLLGSLVGNDFTNHDLTTRQNMHSMFFERQLTLIQRIDRVAATIQSILNPSSNRRKAKHQVGSVMDLIDQTVNSLMARNIQNITSGQVDDIVDKVAEGALQYAIPKYEGEHQGAKGLWPTRICALHEPDTCPLLPSFSRLLEVAARDVSDEEDEDNDELAMRIQIRTRYLDAYRKGHIPPLVMNCLTTSTYWPRQFIESPDLQTVALLGRAIRLWGYAILDDALGLPEEQQEWESLVEQPDDEDELVDVVESDSDMDSDAGGDLLAPLRGALQSLRGSDVSSTDQGALNSKLVPTPRPRAVNEYFRRGSKLINEPVEVPSLADLLTSISTSERNLADSPVPLVLQSQEERLSDSDIPGIAQLPPQQISVALVLRWILKMLSERAADDQNKIRESERWTRREALCFLASFSWDGNIATVQADQIPPIIDRHVQLVAQVLHVLECVDHLANILLLRDVVASPTCMFSGRALHSYLTGTSVLPDVPTALWEACESGLGGAFVEERKKKSKKAKGTASKISPVKTAKGTGLFAMLGDLET